MQFQPDGMVRDWTAGGTVQVSGQKPSNQTRFNCHLQAAVDACNKGEAGKAHNVVQTGENVHTPVRN